MRQDVVDKLEKHLNESLFKIGKIIPGKVADEDTINDAKAALSETIQLLTLEQSSEKISQTNNDPDEIKPDKKPIFIDNIDELDPKNWDSILSQILELIPVQIFLKHGSIDPQRGRKFIWLNSEARQRMGSNLDQIPEYDSDAFANGVRSPEWIHVSAAETSILKQPPETPLKLTPYRWTNPDGTWRINRVIEAPIYKNEDQTAVALCAIAEDISFEKVQSIMWDVARGMNHEIGNSRSTIMSDIDAAITYLNKENLEAALIMIQEARIHADEYARRANLITTAVYNDGENRPQTLEMIVEDLISMTRSKLFEVELDLENADPKEEIHAVAETKAIILELLRNVRKHGKTEKVEGLLVEKRRYAKIAVSKHTDGVLRWTISNRLKQNGIPSPWRMPDPKTGRRGAKLIAQIAENKFGKRFDQIISFPAEQPVDGWVNVEAFLPIIAA